MTFITCHFFLSGRLLLENTIFIRTLIKALGLDFNISTLEYNIVTTVLFLAKQIVVKYNDMLQ